MSMHRIPLTELEREGLSKHGLDIGTPSQLSDCFRLGMRWALEEQWNPANTPPSEIGRYWCYVEEQNDLGVSYYQWNCCWNGESWTGKDMACIVTHWRNLPPLSPRSQGITQK